MGNMLFLLWRYSCSSMLCLESFSDAEAAATFNPCVKEVARRLIEDQSGSQVRGDMQTMGNEVTICSRENENGHRRCADRRQLATVRVQGHGPLPMRRCSEPAQCATCSRPTARCFPSSWR